MFSFLYPAGLCGAEGMAMGALARCGKNAVYFVTGARNSGSMHPASGQKGQGERVLGGTREALLQHAHGCVHGCRQIFIFLQ